MEQIRYIETKYADPEGATPGRIAIIGFSATNKGLSLLGSLWKVDRFVELPFIRDKYRESWSRLWRLNTKLEAQSLQAKEPPHIVYGATRASTQIIFEVIELLHNESQIDIADAIWQSMSDINWTKMRRPESVSDFPEQLTVEKRKGMFLLEPSQDGLFRQKWLIDRIMLQGGVWVGRLMRRSTDSEYSDGVSTEDHENVTESVNDSVDCTLKEQTLEDELRSPTGEHVQLNKRTSGAASAFNADHVARESAQRYPLTSIDRSSVSTIPLSWNKRTNDAAQKSDNVPRHDYFKSISDYQRWLSAATKMGEHAGMKFDEGEPRVDDRDDRFESLGNLMAMASEAAMISADPDGRGSPASLRQQRALFDVEGDISGQILILTPFQKRLETIPRPENRSMSVSWVVQPVSHVDGSEDKEEEVDFFRVRETFQTSRMVRGMWKLLVQPMNRYNLV